MKCTECTSGQHAAHFYLIVHYSLIHLFKTIRRRKFLCIDEHHCLRRFGAVLRQYSILSGWQTWQLAN